MMEGITPVMPVGNNGGAFGGGNDNFMWVLLIFLLLGGNRNAFGANDSGIAANNATNLINNDFLYSQQKIDNLGQALINQTNALNMTMNNGFNSNISAINNLGFQMQQCCCETNRSIDQVRFDNAQNTCAITTAIGESTQSIKDLINCNTMQDLRDRNVALQGAYDNAMQTASIISQLRPYPTPSYLTAMPGVPFGSYSGFAGSHCCNQCC